ncbi:hypothetical protein LINGRAHAP2_LOCUS25955 [Linum grandiflorum]
MKTAKWTSVASSLGLIITIGLHMHHPGACYANRDIIVASDQSGGFQYSWSNKNFDEAQRPHLKYCTDDFKELLEDGKFLNSGDFLDSMITCPGNPLSPDLYTMVHCRDRNECAQCLDGAASLMDQSCVDCIGFRARSEDCWVRYETYSFTSYD